MKALEVKKWALKWALSDRSIPETPTSSASPDIKRRGWDSTKGDPGNAGWQPETLNWFTFEVIYNLAQSRIIQHIFA